MCNKWNLLTLALLLLSAGTFAQKSDLTDEQIVKGSSGIFKFLPRVTGWADKDHYIVSRDGKQYAVNAASGKEKLLEKPSVVSSVSSVFIKEGDVFYKTGKDEKRLTETPSEEKNPQLSPDQKKVAFTRDNNLFVTDVATMQETQYTTDGSDLILNGWASWVYYEEILGRSSNYRAFWWSPDSRKIAFFRSDDTRVPMFPIYNSKGQHGFLEQTRYPKAGDPNPEVKVGIADVNSGVLVWADFNAKDDQYFGMPFWRKDTGKLLVQWMNREQDNLKLYDVDPSTGVKQEVYDEKQPAWIDWIGNIYFVKDGFMMIRDFDGWEQIYYYASDGKLRNKVTNGKPWNTSIVKIDEPSQTIYYMSRAEIPTRTDFYSVKFNGTQQKRLSFGEYSHGGIQLSPDHKRFVTTYSNVTTPTRMAVVEMKNGKVKEIGNSKGEKFDAYNLALPEMLWMKTADGIDLPACVTWPSHLDPDKKYPVLISIYGGPNAGTVFDNWKGVGMNQWWAKEGVIQITIDHRGSGKCGKAGLNYLHRNLGKWEMEDYIAWVKYLYEKPFVDRDKIAINGGSYGGYISAFALTYGSDYFKYGIADFGVMDWGLYDSHYTERYMDRPVDNPEGYKFNSVMTHAGKYKSDGKSMLRIVHGTMDDNVHMQNSIQLIDALQEQKKEFEFMLYPGERHGWGGNKGVHQRNENYRFYYKYLLEKPVPAILFQ